jgi:hypothetical protein
MAALAAGHAGIRAERLFYTGMAVAIFAAVFLGFARSFVFLLAVVAWDLATIRRLHPATLWGGLLLVVSQPLRLAIAGTEPWLAFARRATGHGRLTMASP